MPVTASRVFLSDIVGPGSAMQELSIQAVCTVLDASNHGLQETLARCINQGPRSPGNVER